MPRWDIRERYYAWVPRLCRHYRVVRMDLRGHGESAVPPAEPPLAMERLVQDVAELLDHLGLRARTSSATRPAAISASSSP